MLWVELAPHLNSTELYHQALAAKMQRYNGLAYDTETEIVVTLGATGAFYLAATALLNPGDQVILFEPFYGYHVHTLRALDVEPVFVPTRPPSWAFDAELLSAAITPRCPPVRSACRTRSRGQLQYPRRSAPRSANAPA